MPENAAVDTGAPSCDNGAPLLPKKRRVYMECKEHGRVVAYVFVRRNRRRKDGSVAEDRVKICRICDRLKGKAWRLFKGGREKTAIANARWYADPENRKRKAALQRARRARGERWDSPLRVVALALVLGVLARGRSTAVGVPTGGNGREEVVLTGQTGDADAHRPLVKVRKPKVVGWRFDPCRISPFFCGLVPGP